MTGSRLLLIGLLSFVLTACSNQTLKYAKKNNLNSEIYSNVEIVCIRNARVNRNELVRLTVPMGEAIGYFMLSNCGEYIINPSRFEREWQRQCLHQFASSKGTVKEKTIGNNIVLNEYGMTGGFIINFGLIGIEFLDNKTIYFARGTDYNYESRILKRAIKDYFKKNNYSCITP